MTFATLTGQVSRVKSTTNIDGMDRMMATVVVDQTANMVPGDTVLVLCVQAVNPTPVDRFCVKY